MAHTPHLFLPGPWADDTIPLGEGHLHHLGTVLRLAPGSAVSYSDGEGLVGEGALGDGGVERGAETFVERPSEVTVAVAPPASRQRARFVVEKLAELGVPRLCWIDTDHSEGRAPSDEKARTWSASALEQSRGAWALDVRRSTLADLPEPVVLADRTGEADWPGDAAAVAVGPEGGFSASELDGRRLVSLGPTVLRVETAAIVAATLHRRGRWGAGARTEG